MQMIFFILNGTYVMPNADYLWAGIAYS
jgi:hypothetical protein